MKIGQDTLCDIISSDSEVYTLVEDEIVSSKHSDTYNRAVFHNENKEFFIVYYSRNYEWGVEDGPFDVSKAEATEVTTTIYVEVE